MKTQTHQENRNGRTPAHWAEIDGSTSYQYRGDGVYVTSREADNPPRHWDVSTPDPQRPGNRLYWLFLNVLKVVVLLLVTAALLWPQLQPVMAQLLN